MPKPTLVRDLPMSALTAKQKATRLKQIEAAKNHALTANLDATGSSPEPSSRPASKAAITPSVEPLKKLSPTAVDAAVKAGTAGKVTETSRAPKGTPPLPRVPTIPEGPAEVNGVPKPTLKDIPPPVTRITRGAIDFTEKMLAKAEDMAPETRQKFEDLLVRQKALLAKYPEGEVPWNKKSEEVAIATDVKTAEKNVAVAEHNVVTVTQAKERYEKKESESREEYLTNYGNIALALKQAELDVKAYKAQLSAMAVAQDRR